MTPELLPSLFTILVVLRYAFGIITDEQRLHHEIMQKRHFSKLIKPPGEGDNNTLTVKIAMRLSELLYVSERNQIVTTKMWLRHEWYDVRMKWDPTDFGNITYTHFPIEDMWRPDIVLYNNADGDFEVTLLVKAYVMYTGKVIWEPPAIYKSYCPINVEYFPFDEQECFFKFSSWAYDGIEVDLRHVWEEERGIIENNQTKIPMGVDLCDYSQNFEWDIINVTATRKVKFYPCCQNKPYPDITFWITIRRKTLFYTVNLIMPIVAISTLTALVFYLPSESGEKITLSISILLALTVFFLLLYDISPPTSLVIPLIGHVGLELCCHGDGPPIPVPLHFRLYSRDSDNLPECAIHP
ncbi:acetylcholine receptor subunit alpha-like 1 isoform X2 [Mya arenaria]|uniref:acetylcholine receptor subunit alpha-like 1 isoform X2 n=1 Tax=Mya arenaria TaxID=6604 RepID=UPI0022E2DF85|nr:acetylcholine receptor subunit alpha-like 1 isoform X2 [Mya arenaria]